MSTKHPLVICGGQLKERCGIVCDYTNCCTFDVDSLDTLSEVSFYEKSDNGIVFCNPLFLDHVNNAIDLTNKTLITHNTDSTLVSYDNGVATFMYLNGHQWSVSNLKPKKWLAQNSNTPNVKPIPLGVTDNDIMNFANFDTQKSVLMYKNFGIHNNPQQRMLCDQCVKIQNEYSLTTERTSYYNSLMQSYFTVSPEGYGLDCHRHWEALYFNCIPIVTKNNLTDFYSTIFPMIVIDTWKDFNIEDYTVSRYNSLIEKFDRQLLDIDYYINKLL